MRFYREDVVVYQASHQQDHGQDSPISNEKRWKEGALVGCLDSMYSIWKHGDRHCPLNLSLLRRAAGRGHLPSITALGLHEISSDVFEARRLLTQARSAGCVVAEAELVALDAESASTPEEKARVVAALRSCIARGERNSLVILSQLLSQEGYASFKENGREDVDLLKLAAARGSAYAQHLTGILHARGDVVDRCARTSFEWFLRAARQGDAEAAVKVAARYFRGHGVERDRLVAATWLEIAVSSASGETVGRKIVSLARVLGLTRETLMDSLGFVGVREAARRASEWRPCREQDAMSA